jgi:hypothetical protein
MKKFIYPLMLVLLITAGKPVLAAAPDLLPPLSMQVDPGDAVIARGLDFLHAPLSGAVNFTPQNYDIHLPGGVILPVEDVVPYFGIQQPIKDCQEAATVATATMTSMLDILLQYVFPKVLGADPKDFPKDAIDPKKMYNGILDACTNDPKMVDLLLTQGKLAKQIVADVRNSKVGATDVTFSGQLLDPYTDFPLATQGYGAAVIGGTTANGKDVWSDGIVVASYEPQFANLLGMPLMSSSLNLYRFQPNTASKKVLKHAGISTGWLDKPVMTNGMITNPCFKQKKPVPPNNMVEAEVKSTKELLDAGCVGENLAVAVATPNFYGHPGDKLKDIVVVSRASYGAAGNPASKTGYITLYKRNEALPAPADTSLFQDIWQFDRSYTNATYGMPESYGVAVVKNWDPKANKITDGVVVGSNKLQGTRYYVYYFRDGMSEPKAILVGGTTLDLPGTNGFGPYRVYSTDVNQDRCGDILITRARISPDGKKIEFADYFDVHLQHKMSSGECRETFDEKGSKYQVPAVDPKNPPQISALTNADFNKDGRDDVMLADYTTHLNNTTKLRENFVHFLEYKGGIYNTIQPPRYVVTTKNHGDDVGPIDIKADAYANLGVVTGKALAFAEIQIPPPVITPNPCIPKAEGIGGAPPSFCSLCARDVDGDTLKDLPGGVTEIEVWNCNNNNMENMKMSIDDTPFKYMPDCSAPTISATKTGRQWMHEWMGCDNCNELLDNCTGPEQGGISKCYNPSQSDMNLDGVGDICTPIQKNAPPAPGAHFKLKKHLREDRVMYADEQPVIANYKELKVVDVAVPKDNGHEVTVLLNKTAVKDTKKQCTNGDLACICELNPGLLACKCLKDPKAPGCQPTPESPSVCAVDVCRGDLTAPFPRMCDYIRPFNDQIRKCTGINSDFLIPVEGVQYHVSCTMPNTPAVDLGNGAAYARIYKTGQLPKNYFKDWHKPVADENVSAKPVLLNPAAKAADGADLDISVLPNPSFDADPLLSVLPNATLNQAPGIAQIDGVMEIQTNLIDMAGVAGAGKAVPGGATKVLSLDVKGFSSPPGCQWAGDDCPKPMPNPPSAQEFVDVICAKAKEAEAAGKAVTMDTVNEAFNSMNVGPAFLHQKLVIPGAQTAVIIPMQNTMGNLSAEGGCGCTITATSTVHNTALPLVMALSALSGMLFFRRNSAKKR